MFHGFGLDTHSWDDHANEYGDRWDVLSAVDDVFAIDTGAYSPVVPG
jgi:hypothetical protein